jgi:hypothetical protein
MIICSADNTTGTLSIIIQRFYTTNCFGMTNKGLLQHSDLVGVGIV